MIREKVNGRVRDGRRDAHVDAVHPSAKEIVAADTLLVSWTAIAQQS